MEPFQILDFFGLILIIAAYIILSLGKRTVISRDEELILAGLLLVTIFHNFSNIIEWGFEIEGIDAFADYARILQPVLFGFFLFSHLRFVELSELRKSEEKREFLNTLLRQDLMSKNQVITGYLQLLEEEDFSEEGKSYLKSAIKNSKNAVEIIEEIKNLREIEQNKKLGQKNIVQMLNEAVNESEKLSQDRDFEIDLEFEKEEIILKGNYSLENLFENLLYARTQNQKCGKIKISIEEKNGKVLIKWVDDGEELSDKVKRSISKESYTGETSGVSGFRYYIAREIVELNDGQFEVKNSKLGGARFEITLKKP